MKNYHEMICPNCGKTEKLTFYEKRNGFTWSWFDVDGEEVWCCNCQTEFIKHAH